MTASTPSGLRPAVLSVSSHVVRGSVGNRAAAFALETLGFPVWSLPTVILPWHPGHGPAMRIVPPGDAFGSLADDLGRSAWTGEIRAILSGYMGEASQARSLARLVRTIKDANPDVTYLCDPVIGDRGGLYVKQEVAAAIRDELLPLADIATPNIHELNWLTDLEAADIPSALEAATALGPARVLVTSAPAMMAGSIGNLLLSGDKVMLAEHRVIDNPPNGLGDLFAAVFLARVLEGQAEEKALQMATASVFEILARTAKRGADELTLETDASSLSTPMAMVHMRRIAWRPGLPAGR